MGRRKTADSADGRPEVRLGPRRLLTVAEVASILRCSKQAVYSWVEFGRVPHVKLGRLVRFRPEDVEEFLERNSRPALIERGNGSR